MDYEVLLESMRSRRTVRRLLPDPVPEEKIMAMLEAARWAPSAANGQPWEFIVVRERQRIENIAQIFIDAKELIEQRDPEFPVTDKVYLRHVPLFIVVVGDPRLQRLSPQVGDAVTIDREYTESIAMAVQNLWLAANVLNLGVSHLTIHRYQQKLFREHLKLPEQLRVHCVLPVGYYQALPMGKRRPLADMVHFESYDATKLRSDERLRDCLPPARLKRPICDDRAASSAGLIVPAEIDVLAGFPLGSTWS